MWQFWLRTPHWNADYILTEGLVQKADRGQMTPIGPWSSEVLIKLQELSSIHHSPPAQGGKPHVKMKPSMTTCADLSRYFRPRDVIDTLAPSIDIFF